MRAARALIGAGVVLLMVAALLGVLFGWLASAPVDLVRAADGPPSSVPAQVLLDAAHVEYVVYARSAGAGTPPGRADVRVVSAGGAVVATSPDTGHVLRHAEDEEFRSIARFTAPEDGRYTVEVGGTPGTQVRVVPEVPDGALARLGVAVIGLVISLALLLFALILLAVGLVRRSRSTAGAALDLR